MPDLLVLPVDWRANRLVDALAKAYAREVQLPKSFFDFISSARIAYKHSAAVLGCVTHAANNHKIQVIRNDGTVTYKTIRDSTDVAWRQSGLPTLKKKAPDKQADERACKAPKEGHTVSNSVLVSQPALFSVCEQPASQSASSRALRAHNKRGRDSEKERLTSRVAAIAATCTASPSRQSGHDRLEALKRRVRARL